jgi:hypothetical protein
MKQLRVKAYLVLVMGTLVTAGVVHFIRSSCLHGMPSAGLPGVPGENLDSAKVEADIREAVFRNEMQGLSSHVFLQINGQDPDLSFMTRFKDFSPPPKPSSQSTTGEWLRVLDAETREPGVLLMADGIKWAKKSCVEVEGGWQNAGLSGGGYRYTVKCRNGKWRVTDKQHTWDS